MAQVKSGHDLAFLSYSGKHVEALEIHGMLYLQLASGPVHHVNHHSFASGPLSSHLNHMRQFFMTSWQRKKKNSFYSYIS